MMQTSITTYNKKPKVFIITGLRAGTSLISRGLELAGVNLGEEYIDADKYNRHGYYEDVEFLRLNKQLLENEGGAGIWKPPEPLFQTSSYYNDKVRELVGKGGKLWGWKDPRNTLTGHLYLPHLPEYDKYLVACFRAFPDQVRSIKRINGKFSTERAERYVRLYNERTMAFIRYFIHFVGQ